MAEKKTFKTDAQKDAELGISRTAPTVDERTQLAAKGVVPTQKQIDDAYYTRDPKTGLSPAQLDAQKALAEAQAAREAVGLQGKIVSTPGSAGSISTPPTSGLKEGYEWYAFNIPGGGFEWRQKPTKETLSGAYGKLFGGPTGSTSFGNGSTSTGGGGKKMVSTYKDPVTGDIIAVFDDGSTQVLMAGNVAGDKARAGQSAFDFLKGQFNQFGMGALVDAVSQYIKDGLSADELLLRLRDTDVYKKRFAANAQRIAKGLRALSEAEYIGLEDQYQNIMRNYGLPESYYTRGDLGRQEGFEKFIAGDVSASELEDRIQTAQNRVINANPEITTALKQFYPDITGGDILAYALNPDKALVDIKRKVTAAEIGGAALTSGLATDLARAEQLRAYGVTGQQAKEGYQAIAGVLPRATTLGDIYAKQGLGKYDQATAEAEVFGTPGSAQAAQKRKKLTELEQAQFSGSAGRAGGALARERAGQFQAC